MSFLLFENNYQTTFTNPVAPSDTTVTVNSAAGLPAPGSNQYFVLSFIDAATKLITEIVWCTAVVGTVLTVVRAQEGTTALSWLAGDICSGQWTAGQAAAMLQTTQAQAQQFNYCGSPTGTANAIVAAFTPAITAHNPGTPLRVKIAANNTSAVTINPGPSVVAVTGPDGSALIANDLIAGDVVEFIYNGVSYIVQTVQATASRQGTIALVGGLIPPGGLLLWATNTEPTGFIECDGSSLSIFTYAALFAAIGYTFGGGGSVFSIPDTRGYFIRGWASGSSVDAGRAFGSTQTDSFASHTHNLTFYDNNTPTTGPGHGGNNPLSETTSAAGGSETRPVNIALMYCIKY